METVFLGPVYSEQEIASVLDAYKNQKLLLSFVKDREDIQSVHAVYSLSEWGESDYPELELSYNEEKLLFSGLIPFEGSGSVCYRFRITEPDNVRWEDRNRKNWFVSTQKKISFTKSENIAHDTAVLLSQGAVLGWFRGGSEFGSRALGHRSILADPRKAETKDAVNRIKKREWFRPFAPSIMEEFAQEYFHLDEPSPFMMNVVEVHKEKRGIIPAVVHIDGTARVQTVNIYQEKTFYNLLAEFRKLTGVPVLLNTSFNLSHEPIVETPFDALSTFLNSELDYLVIEDYIVEAVP